MELNELIVRIAYFIPYFRTGGVETTTHRLAAGFRDRGHQVDLLTFGHDSPYLGPDSAFDVVSLDANRTLTAISGVVRYLRTERPNALLSTHYFANICAVWARMLARTETTLILTERILLSRVIDQQDSLKYRLFPLLIRLFYPCADARVTVSKTAARDIADLADMSESAVTPIYNPTLVEEVFEEADEPVDHPWFDDDQPILLGVGRLSRQKGFDVLVDAVDRLNRDDARVLILGDGDERRALDRHVERVGLTDRVELYGFTENPYKFMRAADLFVLSSRFEGMPNVLVEAAALGTPVVATDCPSGPRELLENGKYGDLVPPDDPDALAAAIDATLSDLNKTRDRIERIRPKLEDFRLEAACENYLELIKRHR